MNRKGYEFSFAWIFAILVGAVIIFLAIYTTVKLIDIKRTEIEASSGKQLGTLLTPVETTLEESKLATIFIPDETIIYNECDLDRGIFGSQDISVNIKSGIGDAWRSEQGVRNSFHNKYLFSYSPTRGGEEFYVFSKSLMFPFKVADLVYMWSDKEGYCFVFSGNMLSNDIEKELKQISPTNIINVSSLGDCPSSSRKVCFTNIIGCDVVVDNLKVSYPERGESVFYSEAFEDNKYPLLFAAIFSNKEIYECQVQRLMNRAVQLAAVYEKKSNYLTPKGCSSAPVLPAALISYRNAISSYSSSTELNIVRDKAQTLKSKNDPLTCKLF